MKKKKIPLNDNLLKKKKFTAGLKSFPAQTTIAVLGKLENLSEVSRLQNILIYV